MVSVINAGTTEFEDSNMGEKFDILKLGQLFLTHFPEKEEIVQQGAAIYRRILALLADKTPHPWKIPI